MRETQRPQRPQRRARTRARKTRRRNDSGHHYDIAQFSRFRFTPLSSVFLCGLCGDAAQFESGGLPWLGALDRAGARIYLTTSHAASHNKIVILDGGLPGAAVITGSYNFTQAAQSKNAENVVILSRSPGVIGRF